MKTKLLSFLILIFVIEIGFSQKAVLKANKTITKPIKNAQVNQLNSSLFFDNPLHTVKYIGGTGGLLGSYSNPDVNGFESISPSEADSYENAGDVSFTEVGIAYSVTFEDHKFYRFNVEKGFYQFLGVIPPEVGHNWTGLEFDPLSGELFGVSTNFEATSIIYKIDLRSLEAAQVATLSTMPIAIAIAINGEGSMFGYDVLTDGFYSIDKLTGETVFIGEIGFDAEFGQDLEWDYNNDILYMASFNLDVATGELRTVDVNTGATTLLFTQNVESEQLSWISFKNDGILSVKDKNISKFKVYPNPVTDNKLTIEVPNNEKISSIEMYNILGTKVMTRSEVNSANKTLDVSNLSSGLYMLKLNDTDGNTLAIKKVIKK